MLWSIILVSFPPRLCPSVWSRALAGAEREQVCPRTHGNLHKGPFGRAHDKPGSHLKPVTSVGNDFLP